MINRFEKFKKISDREIQIFRKNSFWYSATFDKNSLVASNYITNLSNEWTAYIYSVTNMRVGGASSDLQKKSYKDHSVFLLGGLIKPGLTLIWSPHIWKFDIIARKKEKYLSHVGIMHHLNGLSGRLGIFVSNPTVAQMSICLLIIANLNIIYHKRNSPK